MKESLHSITEEEDLEYQPCCPPPTTTPSSSESTRLLSGDDDYDFANVKPLGNKFRHFLITLLISGSSLLIALRVPNINTVFGLMGATCSAFVCFVLPGAFAIELGMHEGEGWGKKARIYALTYGGFAVGCLSTAVTLYGIFYPEPSEDFCGKRRR